MAATTKTFPGALLLVLFIFAIVGMLKMPSAIAISCGPGEIQIESETATKNTTYCFGCQEQCRNKCQSQGRIASQVECNFWGNEPPVCKCCCGSSSPTPPPKPIAYNKCPAKDTNEYFQFENTTVLDCNLCVNGCKARCDGIGATVSRQICFQAFLVPKMELVNNFFRCPCCCKPKPPPSPPPPPPPPPPAPYSGSCGVDINIQISTIPSQTPCKNELPQSPSSIAEL